MNSELPPPTLIARTLGVGSATISFLAGDGSDRSYYRIFADNLKTYVLMKLQGADITKLKECDYEWIAINHILSQHQITTPRLLYSLPEYGALIIEDYGDETLEIRIKQLLLNQDQSAVDKTFKQCFNIIGDFINLTQDPSQKWTGRRFDTDKLLWELNAFLDNFLDPIFPKLFTSAERDQLKKDFLELSRSVSEQSLYFTHRDFHSRNIMCLGDRLAVIDFQDARYGSPSYDLVSLCFDSYIPLSKTYRLELMQRAIKSLASQIAPSALAMIQDSWHPVFLQRQVKALGSFGYLTIKKQRGNYLKYVPPALETLDTQLVHDQRWSFLSGEFLTRLERAVSEHELFSTDPKISLK